MILFPNCKINLGLHILHRREDGFHDLETVFYPLPLQDALEVITAGENIFSHSGIEIPGDATDNLCNKAYALLKADYPQLPAVHIHLHKHVPIGAGLGGGSADGAFMLKALNIKYNLDIPEEKLEAYAARLGSDCPFFIRNRPCFATGRGEVMEPWELDLSGYSFLLVHPGIHVNTGWAFGQLTPGRPETGLREVDWKDVSSWKGMLTNDFEGPVFREYPAIRNIKEKMYRAGAVYATMSGSGSAVVGIFPKGEWPEAVWEGHYRVFKL
ncbi:4-(cytidine 5'-diphospho)-2-C-methyl-D-erythritol kinase [Chitinophaga sp. GCM10012297]|uniref:4-diphosphocytidyl-2-C-methyl-D-erythritol kinase n=1 Tax=Chitinophaga chungangae TaxID=2821488 RepID=A0ABS3YJ16_9BACT|nr:4-(cytidine 5'-diphospho)-2-C-methyl-D-erythritol kinase [Chitinophaga chungangae]MBO9154298.1 4-(cytidine 5'-diphospho)-2-C-methyl-D-erythritol kinase [Chitinophaga chungangae]